MSKVRSFIKEYIPAIIILLTFAGTLFLVGYMTGYHVADVNEPKLIHGDPMFQYDVFEDLAAYDIDSNCWIVSDRNGIVSVYLCN